jgi:putative membrane protein
VIVNATFTQEERHRIDRAIAAVKQNTATDLGLMVTRVSDRYPFYPLVWAGLCTLLIVAAVALLQPQLHDRFTIVIELSILTVLTLLFDWLPIRLALVPKRVQHAQARQLAHREFAARSGSGDPTRKRILLFVSLGEHYVEIIADHATHAMVAGNVWDKIVDDLVNAIKSGRVADGAVASIEACGVALPESTRTA